MYAYTYVYACKQSQFTSFSNHFDTANIITL